MNSTRLTIHILALAYLTIANGGCMDPSSENATDLEMGAPRSADDESPPASSTMRAGGSELSMDDEYTEPTEDVEDIPNPTVTIEWHLVGTTPQGDPATCASVGADDSSLYLYGPSESGIDVILLSSCFGAQTEDVALEGEFTDANGGPPVPGTYQYMVSLKTRMGLTIIKSSDSFELGSEDVTIDMELVALTVPVEWTITQDGTPKTCEDVGAAKVHIIYKRGTTTVTSVRKCDTTSTRWLWPVSPRTYTDLRYDLLDAQENVIASWATPEPFVLTKDNTAPYPAAEFAL